ncbi:hypothetical protein IT575_12065 [bacterium]|nr:hypothetical protein [bacterium]
MKLFFLTPDDNGEPVAREARELAAEQAGWDGKVRIAPALPVPAEATNDGAAFREKLRQAMFHDGEIVEVRRGPFQGWQFLLYTVACHGSAIVMHPSFPRGVPMRLEDLQRVEAPPQSADPSQGEERKS